MTTPSWVQHAIWYHVYPLGFLDAPKTNPGDASPVEHRLRRLEVWLDYMTDLGANGLLLGPIFESETHGYDTTDHGRVDRRLGDEADVEWLLEEGHRRGMRVVFDGVFNHVGRSFPAFADVRRYGLDSRYAPWFRLEADADAPDGFRYASFEGHDRLVVLNHDNAEVLDLCVDVACHWLARGVDGFRLDAAYAVPAEFWRAFTARVGDAFPAAWIMGEVIHGDHAAYAAATGIGSVTQYELWKAIWSSLNDGNLFELAHALDRHNTFAAGSLPHTFLGNHDVTRIATQLDDPRHLPHALVVLCTAAGTPSIYAGDEQGFTGTKHHRPDGDDEIRPAFPSSPAHLGGGGWATYRLHQDLIALRRRHPGLAVARTEVLHLTNQQIAYRSVGADDAVTVVLNLADTAAELPTDDPTLSVEAGDARPGDGRVALPAHGWAVLARTAR